MEISEITEELKKMRHEVKELHPHFKVFLPRIDGVGACEYTHGSNEKGADFVLEHTPMGVDTSVDHVGVIIKNGTLKDQSGKGMLDDVLRQIGQLQKMERPFNGRTVQLNMAWVFVNGNITNNARERIASEGLMGVRFYDQDATARLMHRYGYEPLGSVLVHVMSVLHEQKLLAEAIISSNASPYALGSKFAIERLLYKQHENLYLNRRARRKLRIKRKEKLPPRKVVDGHSSVVLVGEPSSGKTHILASVLKFYADSSVYRKTRLVPVYTTAPELMKNHDGDLDIFLSKFKKDHDLSEKDSVFLLMIDDIDQCDGSLSDRVDRINQWYKKKPRGIEKIIFATRDNPINLASGISTFGIAELSMTNVMQVIESNLQKIDSTARILDDLAKSDLYRSLPQNPLAISFLIRLLNESEGNEDLPANLPELFSRYSEHSLGRWDKSSAETQKQRKYTAADAILSNIANYMIENKLIFINEDEAKAFFTEYLSERRLDIDPCALYSEIVHRSADLLHAHDRIFKFRHRSVCEFFNARSRQFNFENIKNLGENAFHPQWMNSVYFFAGIEKECPELIEWLSSISPTSDGGKVSKFLNMSNIMLAGFATRYNSVEEGLYSAFVDMFSYIDQVIKKEADNSGLYRLSVMDVLWLFRFITEHHYGRKYFSDAIGYCMVRIENSDLSDDVKSIALFMLNIAHRGAGGDDIFSGMINNRKVNIPTTIQLAIDHETEYEEKISTELKAYKRHLRKTIAKNPNIGGLYDQPIMKFLNK